MNTYNCFTTNSIDKESEFHYHFYSNIRDTADIHYHNFYELFLITKGTMIHIVNNNEQLLSKGHLVFIRDTDIHYYKKNSNMNCEFINLAFFKETLVQMFKYLDKYNLFENLLTQLMPPTVFLTNMEFEDAERRLRNLNLLPHINKNRINLELRTILVDFFSKYFYENEQKIELIPTWLQFINLEMNKKENFSKGLVKLYEFSNKTPEHVSRSFKKFYHKTPSTFVNELRLNYAANLLIHSDKPILDISLETGFENLSYFYTLFKKYYSISPLKFRKLNQTNFMNNNT